MALVVCTYTDDSGVDHAIAVDSVYSGQAVLGLTAVTDPTVDPEVPGPSFKPRT